jgi:putative flippase GtrA
MFRTFASGRGTIDFGPAARRPLTDDFGRRLVSFGLIGLTSTVVSLALFLLLQGSMGPIAANAVAVSATFLANTWANARLTMRGERPRWGWAGVLYAGSLALTSAALLVVERLGGGLTAEVLALLATWTVVAVGRLLVMSRESIEGTAA